MPLRKFRRRFRRPTYARRRYAARRRRFVRSRVRRPRVGRHVALGIPARKFVKLRYTTAATLDAPTGGAPNIVRYRCNSIWDPEVVTGGDKPLYTDRWAGMYSNYVVLASVCRTRWVPTGTGNVVPGICAIVQALESQPLSTVTTLDLMSGKYTSRWTVVGNSVGIVNRPQVLKSVWRRRRFFPATTVADADQIGTLAVGTSGGSDPLDTVVFNVCYGDIAGVDPAPVTIVTQIDYYALLFNINLDEFQPETDVSALLAAEEPGVLREVSAETSGVTFE